MIPFRLRSWQALRCRIPLGGQALFTGRQRPSRCDVAAGPAGRGKILRGLSALWIRNVRTRSRTHHYRGNVCGTLTLDAPQTSSLSYRT